MSVETEGEHRIGTGDLSEARWVLVHVRDEISSRLGLSICVDAAPLTVYVDDDLQLEPVAGALLATVVGWPLPALNIRLTLRWEPSLYARERPDQPHLWLNGLSDDLRAAVVNGHIALDPPWPGAPVGEPVP